MAENKRPPREVGRLEWIVGGVGALIVAATLAVLLQEAITHPDGPPVMKAQAVKTERTSAGYVVVVDASNDGPVTAAEVVVRAKLTHGGEVEEAENKLDYIARGSRREAGFIFRSDPATGTLETSVVSYRKP